MNNVVAWFVGFIDRSLLHAHLSSSIWSSSIWRVALRAFTHFTHNRHARAYPAPPPLLLFPYHHHRFRAFSPAVIISFCTHAIIIISHHSGWTNDLHTRAFGDNVIIGSRRTSSSPRRLWFGALLRALYRRARAAPLPPAAHYQYAAHAHGTYHHYRACHARARRTAHNRIRRMMNDQLDWEDGIDQWDRMNRDQNKAHAATLLLRFALRR